MLSTSTCPTAPLRTYSGLFKIQPSPQPPCPQTEVFEHEHVSSELKKQIQQARLAKKLTQAQVRW